MKLNFPIAAVVWFYLTGFLMIGVSVGCGDEPSRQIIIESTPPGAKVFLDDEYQGITPMSVKEKKIQAHKLNLFLKGYYEYQTSGVLGSINHYSLIPYEHTLEIQFSPAPDLLFLDNRSIKPDKKLTLSLSLGNHQIFGYVKNHPFLEQELQVRLDSPAQIKLTFPPKNTKTRLEIKGVPKDIEVYYENNLIGITPLTLINLPIEPILFNFKNNEYEEKSVLIRLEKGENRVVIVRLTPIDKQIKKLVFRGVPPDSQIMVNGDLQVAQKNQGQGEMIVPISLNDNLGKAEWQYSISHPDFYQIQGKIPVSVLSNDLNRVLLSINPILKINKRPKKILSVSLPKYDTVLSYGDFYFFSDYSHSEIKVYDLGLNPIKTYSMSKVGDWNSPLIMTGFDYSGYYLLGSRIISSSRVFPFSADNLGIVNPVYLSDYRLGEQESVAVFDNGDNRIKLFDLSKRNKPTLSITARDYFQVSDPVNRIKSEYLLPLRFGQAIKQGERLLFTDVVNQDIKFYDPTKSNQVGYFFSGFEKKPTSPQAITSYHDMILAGDKTSGQVWVYNSEGKFIHNFDLGGFSSPRFMFVRDRRLYLFAEEAAVFFLE